MGIMPTPSTKKYTAGSVIMQEKPPGGEMIILIQGSVRLYKNYQKFDQVELEAPRPGEIFGEMSLFLNKEKEETAVAMTDCTVMHVDAKNAKDIFSKQPDLAYSVMSNMCKKFDALNKKYEKLNEKTNPAPNAEESKSSSLFPPDQGSYTLPLTNDKEQYVFKQKCKCPLCGVSFESLSVLTSRLRRESTDRDLRVHYAEVEPMFYDIISCPNCLYSAPSDLFPTAAQKFHEDINQELNKFLTDVEIKIGEQRDTFTVFAGYYLAIRCVPICFDEYQLILAGLWQKLSRIYKDCGDEKMFLYASENAIKNYEHVYQNFYISEKQSQQICYILGDLYERFKDYDKARNFFFLAKSNRDGFPTMKIQADKRLDEIKLLMGQ